MTYVPLILFSASLLSIIIMIWRKLLLLQNGQISNQTEVSFEVPHLQKVKHLTIANIKKYEHIFLVAILRFYLKSINLVKSQYEKLKLKIKSISVKYNGNTEKKEISKFLKIIADYKYKIREIKHKIRKEENM